MSRYIKRNSVLVLVALTAAASFTAMTASDCASLTLSGLPKGLIYFTDQPHRMAGRLSTTNFLKVWHHQDESQPRFKPNVAVQGRTYRSNNTSYAYNQVVALSHPQFNVESDQLQFKACPLPHKKIAMEKSLKNVTIFYDQFSQWPP